MTRIEAAELAAVGFHEPNRLQDERRNAAASAAAHDSVDEIRARGLRLRDMLVASHVLGTSVDDRLVS